MNDEKPPATTLGDVIRFQGRNCAAKTALEFDGRRTSYAELDAASNRVANALLAAGLRPGGRVAHIGRNSARYFELLFGVVKAGGVLVGINWRLSPGELAFVIADSGARFAFIEEDFFDAFDSIERDLVDLWQIIAFTGEHADWPQFADWRDAQTATDPEIAVSTEDIAVQMYTSGTTGKPKGAQIRHHGILHPRTRDHLLGDWAQWRDDEVQLVCTPMFHVSGCVWAMYGLYAGGRVLIHRDFDVPRILKDIPGKGVTRVIFVPAMMQMILQDPVAHQTDYSSLRVLYYGASPIPLELLKKSLAVFDVPFAQLYGLTETSGAATYLSPEDHRTGDDDRLRACGRPYPGTEIRITDPNGQSLGPGQVGEIEIRSDLVMKGYWRLEEDNARAIRNGGWFRTGDAGYLDADGYLYIFDRVKDMIISGGENIYPAEVESVLHEHPGVRDVAVIGVPSDNWGECVKAIVVPASDAAVSEADLIAHAREHLAHFKCPHSIDFVDALPRNAAGKLLKRALRKPYWEGHRSKVI